MTAARCYLLICEGVCNQHEPRLADRQLVREWSIDPQSPRHQWTVPAWWREAVRDWRYTRHVAAEGERVVCVECGAARGFGGWIDGGLSAPTQVASPPTTAAETA